MQQAYIDNAAEGSNRIGSVDGLGAAAGILHNRGRHHNDVLSRAGELLDDKVDHLPQAGILVLEKLRNAEEKSSGFIRRELLPGVEEKRNLGEEDTASSWLDRGAAEETCYTGRFGLANLAGATIAIGDRTDSPRELTFLEHLGPIYLDQAQVGIFVLLAVAHGGRRWLLGG